MNQWNQYKQFPKSYRRGVQPRRGKRSNRGVRIVLIGALLAAYGAGALLASRPASASVIVRRNFQRVLSAMREPSATGLLIVSVRLSGSTRRAGLRPGDIITWVAHHRIESPEQLALICYRLRHSPLRFFSVAAARADRVLHFNVPLSSLKFSGLAVMAGVPAPLNPPPTPFTMHWNRAAFDASQHGFAENFWYRLFDHHIAIGMVHLQISRTNGIGHLLWSVRAVAGSGVNTRRTRMAFWVGDNRREPPFLLKSLTIHDFHRRLRLIRRGAMLTPSRPHVDGHFAKIPILFNVVPTPALMALALAMPRRTGLVLDVPELGISNLHTRPGCAMEVMGPKRVIFAGQRRRLWCVRILRLDVPQMTCWMDRFGHILRINMPHHRQLFLAADAAAAQTRLSLPKLPQ